MHTRDHRTTITAMATALTLTGALLASLVTAPPASAQPTCTLVGSAQIPLAGPGIAPHTIPTSWAAAPGPHTVALRSNTHSFNQRYQFALHDGNLITRAIDGDSTWRIVPLPGCLSGRITALSADDDEVALIATDGYIYTLDRVTSTPAEWNVTSRWGAPFWQAPGRQLPTTGMGKWSYSVNNRNYDHHYLDAAARPHTIGAGRMTMIAALTGDGSDILMLDPWLPNDDSYKVPAPENGRFKATQISTSASTFLVANDTGEMYVRSWDFDRAGSDVVFFRYHWDRRDHLPTAPSKMAETFNPAYAANQLPVPDWTRLPAIPGALNSGISVSAPSPRTRLIRAAGTHNGVAGTWDMLVPVDDIELGTMDTHHWSFTPADIELGPALNNLGADHTAELSAPRGPALTTTVAGQPLKIEHFDLRTDRLEATYGGQPATLHIVDGLRVAPNGPELNQWPRHMHGAIELEQPGNSVRGTKIIPVTFVVTDTALVMYPL
ncbi:hypothetical protein [Corynebacterium aquilae]|uniref:Uncharacterized protein n=1 Tax=Corynebacterium aquilae DSM 44791 TaxID=1431546 RepID=A0A1L7CHF2_9CORY|nr:hypothetical protein [Corynebacterium aquilae]APT85286.1 hypothetical protein CAQU_09620 [Corynebacterium aquilae DSM 44791]